MIGLRCVEAQLLPPPPAPKIDPNAKYEEPPEEDESLAAPKVYTFNPLQAKKEMQTGEFHMKRGNYKGAAYRFREATLWDEGLTEALFKLGEANEKLKDYDAAREAFAKFAKAADDKKKVADVQKRVAKYPKSGK
jgi:tetratricopeptide (TPR) repeat protein